MDYLRDYIALALSVMALGSSLWALLQGPSRANAAEIVKLRAEVAQKGSSLGGEIEALRERVSEDNGQLRERMATAELTLKQLPDKETVHRLEILVEKLAGDLHVAVEKLSGVDRTARRVEEFLLEQAKK